ncbi:MAG TPA: S41 family peptidase [Thermoanaerobaculia bacterium]|nr:S41 family peptidase [Thermoanaerobaculia bacterium]
MSPARPSHVLARTALAHALSTIRGCTVVLVDEQTASDGEAFAEGFRRLGLGPVIGTRTWGGEIWLGSSWGVRVVAARARV